MPDDAEPSGAVSSAWRTLSALGRRAWRWRVPLVVVPLIGGLVVAGAIGARLLRATVPDTSTVTCWNGQVRAAASCSQPSGAAGLRWVFPAFDPTDDRCAARPAPGRGRVGHPRGSAAPTPPTSAATSAASGAIVWTCRVGVGRRRASVTYTERTDLDRGLSVIRHQYRGVRPVRVRGGERLLWKQDRADADGAFDLVEAYAGVPFSVRVTAPTAAVRDAALERFVQFRKVANITVRPDVESR